MTAGTSATTRRRWLVVGLVAVALLGVGAEFALEGPPWAGGRRILWRGSSTQGHISANFHYFDGPDGRNLAARTGEALDVRYTLAPEQGTLTLRLLGPDGQAIWSRAATRATSGSARLELPASGRYRIEIEGARSRGSFDVRYQASVPGGG